MIQVRKAVIAAAGFGTRFLPQTKAMPKEMLPLVDKPIIQYVVEDLVEAGIKDIILVTASGKRSIEEHFDRPNEDLIANLRMGGASKASYIKDLEAIANLANFVYVRQKGSYGAARPLLNAANLVGNEPFIYAFADDLIVAKPNRFSQMIDLYNRFKAPILPCIEVKEEEDFHKYGIISGRSVAKGIVKMSDIVEKPGRKIDGSNFASVGGYLLTPDIFSFLEEAEKSLLPDQEFQIQPVMRQMISKGLPFYACLIKNSQYYDTGSKIGYLKAVIDFALERDEIGSQLKQYLHNKLKQY